MCIYIYRTSLYQDIHEMISQSGVAEAICGRQGTHGGLTDSSAAAGQSEYHPFFSAVLKLVPLLRKGVEVRTRVWSCCGWGRELLPGFDALGRGRYRGMLSHVAMARHCTVAGSNPEGWTGRIDPQTAYAIARNGNTVCRRIAASCGEGNCRPSEPVQVMILC